MSSLVIFWTILGYIWITCGLANLAKASACQIFSILASTYICQKVYLFLMLRLAWGKLGEFGKFGKLGKGRLDGC